MDVNAKNKYGLAPLHYAANKEIAEQQPYCVQVVEGVGLVVFRSLGVFQNFQGDVFYHAFYLGFVLQHMRRSEMSFKVR